MALNEISHDIRNKCSRSESRLEKSPFSAKQQIERWAGSCWASQTIKVGSWGFPNNNQRVQVLHCSCRNNAIVVWGEFGGSVLVMVFGFFTFGSESFQLHSQRLLYSPKTRGLLKQIIGKWIGVHTTLKLRCSQFIKNQSSIRLPNAGPRWSRSSRAY